MSDKIVNKKLLKLAENEDNGGLIENLKEGYHGITRNLSEPDEGEGSWWNPFVLSHDKLHDKRQAQLENQLGHAATIGSVGLTLPFLIKALASKGQNKERRQRMKMLEQAAESKYPVLSPDPLAKEDEEKKTASENNLKKTSDFGLGSLVSSPFKVGEQLLGLGDKSKKVTYPVLALATIAGSTGLGFHMAGKQSSKNRQDILNEKLKEARNQLNRTQYGALAEQKGIDLYKDEEKEKTASEDSLTKQAGVMQTLGGLVALLTAGLGYGGYKIGQHYGKQDMPKRKAYKEMKQEVEDKAKYSDEPVQLMLSEDPAMQRLFGKNKKEEDEVQRKEKTLRSEEVPGGTVDVV